MFGFSTKEKPIPPGEMVQATFPILYSEQPAGHADRWSYHYPPAQAEHGRYYNNTYYGNAIPNSMLATSKMIPGVNILPWVIQYNKELVPYQLKNTIFPYGTGGMSGSQSANFLQQASQLWGSMTGGNNG
jgi:hypothetical protein